VVLAIEAARGADGQRVVTYQFDPSRPEALGARRLVDEHIQRAAGRRDPVKTADQTALARGGRYIDWLVPGLLGMQLLSGALWGTAWNIVNARQRRLLKRLAATPMRRSHYLLSFRIAGLLFVPVQAIVLFLFARVTFGVTIHGSLVGVLLLSLFGSWSFAGLGLLCAARAQNSETANGLVNLMTLPMFVLSGVFFSSGRFPAFLQPVIRLLPLSAFNDALRHMVNDGASLWSQGLPLAVLLVWGVVSSTVALRLFRWS
jgi:ABC-type multidrug transport system permease subunit